MVRTYVKPACIAHRCVGPAGKLLEALDRHPNRPAHIHVIVSLGLLIQYIANLLQIQKDGYKPVTTQIFDRRDPYLVDDSVFAVKDSLIVDFKPLSGNPKAVLELEYNFVVAPQGESHTKV